MHWYKLFPIFPSGPLHRDRPGKQRPQDTHCQNQAGLRATHLHWLVPGLGLRLLDQRPPGARYGRTGDLRSPSLPFYQPRPLTPPPTLPLCSAASTGLQDFICQKALNTFVFLTFCRIHVKCFNPLRFTCYSDTFRPQTQHRFLCRFAQNHLLVY